MSHISNRELSSHVFFAIALAANLLFLPFCTCIGIALVQFFSSDVMDGLIATALFLLALNIIALIVALNRRARTLGWITIAANMIILCVPLGLWVGRMSRSSTPMPEWFGFLRPEIVAISIVAPITMFAIFNIQPPQRGTTHCKNCGYDLRGSVGSNVCPECGHPIATSTPTPSSESEQ